MVFTLLNCLKVGINTVRLRVFLGHAKPVIAAEAVLYPPSSMEPVSYARKITLDTNKSVHQVLINEAVQCRSRVCRIPEPLLVDQGQVALCTVLHSDIRIPVGSESLPLEPRYL